jgi:hypothetical protein
MSIDVEILGEAFSILKQYIPSKDRQEASDNLISSMVDMMSDHDLKEFAASDPALMRAFKEYACEDEDEDLEDLDE